MCCPTNCVLQYNHLLVNVFTVGPSSVTFRHFFDFCLHRLLQSMSVLLYSVWDACYPVVLRDLVYSLSFLVLITTWKSTWEPYHLMYPLRRWVGPAPFLTPPVPQPLTPPVPQPLTHKSKNLHKSFKGLVSRAIHPHTNICLAKMGYQPKCHWCILSVTDAL